MLAFELRAEMVRHLHSKCRNCIRRLHSSQTPGGAECVKQSHALV